MLGHEMDYLMIFVSLLGYFLLANIVCYSVRSFRDVEVLLYVYLWGHAVVAVLCLAATSGIVDVGKAFGHPLASEAWFGLRLFLGTENNPNGSAAHYVVGLPICLYAFMTTRGTKKWLLLVLLVAMTLELVMTLGRSALIGAAIGCVIVLYFIAPARGKKLAIYVVPAVALAGMIFLPIMIHTYANLFGSGSAMQGAAVLIASKNESNEVHGNVLQGAVLLAATAPPWGIGFGNTSAAMQTLTGYYLNTHNFFLGVAVSYGIPALIVFVIALFVAIREVWSATLLEPDRKRRGAYAAILGAIVGYLVSAMVHEDYVNSLFWTMISLALACGTVAGKARAPLIVCSENLGTGEEFYVGRD
jgi:O-antigen ligase